MAVNPTFAQGIDISKWNGSYNPTVKPVDFVIQRLSYGLTKDQKKDELQAAIQPVPIKGCYHYYMTRYDWKQQADFYLSLAGNNYDFYAWDYENIDNNLTKQTAETALQAISYIKNKTGKECFLYTGSNSVFTNFLQNGLDITGLALWVAQWYRREWYYSDNVTGPRLPDGVTHWDIWQWGGDFRHPSGWSVPGYKQGAEYGVASDNIDLNAYNGTIHQMADRLGVDLDEPTPPPPTPTDPEEFKVTIIASALNIRTEPAVSATKVGTYRRGERVAVTSLTKTGKDLWLQTPLGWIASRYKGFNYTDLCK